MKQRRNAFTLIELLVVIAIIAILAAILFPVFAAARESARKTSCLSNTKQLGLGMMQYLQDYDEKFPAWQWGGTPPNDRFHEDSGSYWCNAIYPYVKNTAVYRCPSDPLEWTNDSSWTTVGPDKGAHDLFRTTASSGNFWDKPNNPNYISYGFNEVLGYPNGRKLAAINKPAEFSVMAESAVSLYSPWEDTTRNPDWIVPRAAFAADAAGCCLMWQNDRLTPQQFIGMTDNGRLVTQDLLDKSARHQTGLNVTYVDGHSKWMKWQKASWGNLSPF